MHTDMAADQNPGKDLRYSGEVVRAAVEAIKLSNQPPTMPELIGQLEPLGYCEQTIRIGIWLHMQSSDFPGGVFTINKDWKLELLSGVKPAVLERRLKRADHRDYSPTL